jgi:hypothetical protein
LLIPLYGLARAGSLGGRAGDVVTARTPQAPRMPNAIRKPADPHVIADEYKPMDW